MRWTNRTELSLAAALMLSSAFVASRALPQRLTLPAARRQEAVPSPTPSSPSTEAPRRTLPDFFVMIDPGHGGDDKGATLGGKLLEKDVTLIWARELKRQLEERGIPARLLRDSDQNLSLERRAEITNESHAAIYIALHAGPPGNGARVYRPWIPFTQQPAAGRFLPWENAQAASLERSRAAAHAVAAEARKQDLQVVSLATPLRPLNNLVAPAIAVELTPSPKPLESQKRQNMLASAIASAIAQIRGQMGGRP